MPPDAPIQLNAPRPLPEATVRAVPALRPLAWLALGWRDFTRAMVPSALQGLLFVLGGYAIILVGWGRFHLLSGAFSGFLLVAPVLAAGFYQLSRCLERGDRPCLAASVSAWRRARAPLLWVGLMLIIAGTFWVLISVVMIALFVKAPITGLEGFLRHVVLSQSSHLFEVWMALGGVVAALVFSATAVSVPLLLDRDVDVLTAIVTSIRAVGENPVAMALWAVLIMLLTGLGFLTALLGLVLAIPVVGHATWHAYRDVVDASVLPPRD